MKFSYQWIREWVEGLETDPAALEKLITTRTAECEGIEEVGGLLAEASPALVVAAEPVEGSHNVKAVVETERYGRKTVVCGAPNCRLGLRTVYVPIGVKKIGGVESDGMLASAAELGISKDHSGIVEVSGTLPERDYVIEIDNKSLTHRPDLWGHYGMAREVTAITGRSLRSSTQPARPSGLPAIHIEIADFDLCPRYSALVFENITVQPSPLWLQYRLTAIGLNPINNIVDLTNYVMAELSQPMHAFDRALLRGDTIYARPARDGESITALNHEHYELNPSNLVIADEGGPIAIAGVIGGLESAISEKTTSIVLESANFNATSVRKTSSALKLRTDASMRFEKSQDPTNTVRGLARAVELLQELSPGARLVGGLADCAREIPAPPKIRLDLDWLARKLGRAVPAEEVREILHRLGFGVSADWEVTVPSWRATKDISVADDLVEEVGRMIGYESIPAQAPAVLAGVPPDFPERTYHRRLRTTLTGQGFTEVQNYSFLSEEQAARFGFDPAAHLRVLNPIAANQSLMRLSLIPGIAENIAENSKHFASFRIFEIGREIHKRAGRVEKSLDAARTSACATRSRGLPDEIPHLVAAVYSRDDGAGNLFEMKRVAEFLAENVRIQPAEARSFEHPRRTADVFAGDVRVGRLAELHPSILEGRAAILDLDLRALASHERRPSQYVPLHRYPSSAFDLSVLAAKDELAGDIQDKLAALAGPLLDRIEYVGAYQKSDRKSVTFRFTVGAPDRTLSSEEVGAVRAAVIEGMRRLGYELTL